VRLEFGARTDVGQVRALNEDGFVVSEEYCAVADGMGGHRGGEVASALALEAFDAVFDRAIVPISRVAGQGAGVFYHVHKELLRQRGVIRTAKVREPAPAVDELTQRELQDVIDTLYRI